MRANADAPRRAMSVAAQNTTSTIARTKSRSSATRSSNRASGPV
ncbi:Uncharacterised protein [Mycobacteroides abscessus]|nr:Uncharacterised protein [Mycobacteroides abscessus]